MIFVAYISLNIQRIFGLCKLKELLFWKSKAEARVYVGSARGEFTNCSPCRSFWAECSRAPRLYYITLTYARLYWWTRRSSRLRFLTIRRGLILKIVSSWLIDYFPPTPSHIRLLSATRTKSCWRTRGAAHTVEVASARGDVVGV